MSKTLKMLRSTSRRAHCGFLSSHHLLSDIIMSLVHSIDTYYLLNSNPNTKCQKITAVNHQTQVGKGNWSVWSKWLLPCGTCPHSDRSIFEKLVHISSNIWASLDLHQFTFRATRVTLDAMLTALHSVLTHLEGNTNITVLLVDFIWADNTVGHWTSSKIHPNQFALVVAPPSTEPPRVVWSAPSSSHCDVCMNSVSCPCECLFTQRKLTNSAAVINAAFVWDFRSNTHVAEHYGTSGVWCVAQQCWCCYM